MPHKKRGPVAVLLVALVILLTFLFFRTVYQSDTLYYKGGVNQEFLDQVRNATERKIKRIVVDSKGGNIPIAIEIADIVQENKIQIVVDGYCLSACAEIILPAGKDNIVKHGSLIAFHNLAGVWFYLDKYTEKKYNLSLQNVPIYRYSKEVIELHKRVDLNPDIFIAVTLRKGVVCLGGIDEKIKNPEKEVFLRFSSEFYVPNQDVLEQFGWTFKELNLPQNDEEMDKLIEPLLAKHSNTNFIIERDDYVFPDFFADGGMQFTHLEKC